VGERGGRRGRSPSEQRSPGAFSPSKRVTSSAGFATSTFPALSLEPIVDRRDAVGRIAATKGESYITGRISDARTLASSTPLQPVSTTCTSARRAARQKLRFERQEGAMES